MDVKSLSLPYSLLGSQTLIFKKRRIGYIRRNEIIGYATQGRFFILRQGEP